MHYLGLEPHTVLAAAAVVVAPLAAVPFLRRRDRAGAVRRASAVLLLGALLAVLSVTLLGSTAPSSRVNVIPGASVAAVFQEADRRNALENALGNIALFVPLGFLGVLALRREVLAVTALAAAVSFSIEVTQFVLGDRWTDVDDVLLNSFGAFVGAVAAVVIVRFAGAHGAGR